MTQLNPTWPEAGDDNWNVPLISNLTDMVNLLNAHDTAIANGVGAAGATFVDAGDGTIGLIGPNVSDNGDGTVSIN